MTRPGGSPAAGAPAADAAASSVYVYGVIGADSRGISATGVGSDPAPLRVLGHDGLAAVVSDVPARWRAAGRRDLEAHDRVLAALTERGPVIPMRFGIVMDSDEEVRERLLEAHAPELASLLERLQGRVQMSVKAYYVEEALLRGVLQRHPYLKQRSRELERLPADVTQPQRVALGHDVADAVQEQRALDEQTLVERLAELADDLRVDPPVSERQVATIQILVDSRRRPELDTAVERLSAEHGDRFAIRYVGPMPPYSFTDLALTEPG